MSHQTDEREGTRRSGSATAVVTFAVLVLAAVLTRLAWLGRWSISDDEIYTIYQAFPLHAGDQTPALGAFPVSFLLTRLSAALLSVFDSIGDEFRFRFLHAVAGILGVLLVSWQVRRLNGWPTALILAALICFSPWHLYQSQFVRYYATLFLLAGMAGVLYHQAMRTGSTRAGIAVTLLSLAAVLTHPTALLLVAVLVVDALVNRRVLRQVRGRRIFGCLALGFLGSMIAFALWRWSDIKGSVVWSLALNKEATDTPVDLIQGLVYNLGPHVAVVAALSLPLIWRRDRIQGLFLGLWIALPLAIVLILAALRVPVGQRYLIISMPACLWLAARGLAELAGMVARKERWVAVALPCVAIALSLPSFLSHYQDGDRHDYRGAARYLREHAQPDDLIVSEAHALVARYAAWPEAKLIEAPPPSQEIFNTIREAERLWVVMPDAFTRTPGWTGTFARWVTGHCRIAKVFYAPRLDYHQNILWVLWRDGSR